METVLSGIRSTGNLHLGNYFGAVKNFIKMQNENNCYFFIADYHSLTTHPTPADLHNNVRKVLAEYLATGIDPERSTIYGQSDVPEIPELYLLLNMNAYIGELERTTSFKDKVRAQPDNVNAGLLTYPVLMAADILIHNAGKVPVGKDQEQNLEMARKFAKRFNHMYKVDYFNEPTAYNFGEELIKIPGLDGEGKMGKSTGNGVYLIDDPKVIRKKVMKANCEGEMLASIGGAVCGPTWRSLSIRSRNCSADCSRLFTISIIPNYEFTGQYYQSFRSFGMEINLRKFSALAFDPLCNFFITLG